MSIVKATTEDDLTWAITSTAGGRREVIEPHHNKVQEMNHDLLGQVGIWECADNATRAFLNKADASFDFTNMFRGSRRVEIDCGDMITDLVKLIVHQEDLNREPGLVVNPKDAIENDAKVGSGAFRSVFNCD